MGVTLDQLPSHVLTIILRHVIESPGGEFRPQISVIRVCSAFYLAGIADIYRTCRVSKPHLFFLHDSTDTPSDVDALRSEELLNRGHYKLAALRHVRRLHINMPNAYIADDDEDLQMTDAQKAQVEMDNKKKIEEQWGITQSSLEALPLGMMPALQTLQMGTMASLFDSASTTHGDETSALVLPRAAPQIWCQYYGRITPSGHPYRQIATDKSNYCLPTLYSHTRLNHSFSIVPGSTTYLYIQRQPPSIPGARPLCWRYREDPEAVGKWLGHGIWETLALLRLRLVTLDHATIAATRIIIGGAVSKPRDSSQSSESSVEERELERAQEVAGFARKTLISEPGMDLKDVQIEVRIAAEMAPCPVCGCNL